MKNITRYIIWAIIALALISTGAFIALTSNQVAATSPQGATFTTEKTAGIAIQLANPGANATTSSILNTDANDRYVSSFHFGCENIGTSKTAYTGAGLANLQGSIGTTSTSVPITPVFTFPVALNFNLGTGTSNLLVSSSTLATATSSNAMVWPAGSYMTFQFNATNTAACTVGVDYFGS